MALTIQSIPLFPLDIVLFSGMTLPLHIFEPRYRKMLGDCMARSEPFGLVWAEEEPVSLEMGRPLIGTTAVLTDVEPLPDERFNIQAIGGERFVVRNLTFAEPYLVGEVEPFPLREGEGAPAQSLRPILVRLLHRYVQLLSRLTDEDIPLADMPDDVETVAYTVAVYYQAQNWRKQELLALPTAPELLAREIELLRVEVRLVEHIVAYHDTGELPPVLAGSLALFGLS